MTVSVLLVRTLAAELARRGHPFEDLLADVGLSRSQLDDSLLRLDVGRFYKLIDSAFERAGDCTIGLEAGLRAPVTALGVVGPLLLVARNLRSALTTLCKYLPLLLQGAAWRVEESGDSAVLSYEVPLSGHRGARFCTEYAFAFATRIGRSISSGASARDEVRFAHSAPSTALSRYSRVFGCPVRFDARDNAIVLPRSRMNSDQLHGDATMERVLAPHADHMLSLLDDSPLASLMRAYLRNQPTLSDMRMERAAAHFQLTIRTMCRHLAEEGAAFSTLLDQERAERARRELLLPDASVRVVAHRLGYTTPAAFTRACQRWMGQPPATYIRGGWNS